MKFLKIDLGLIKIIQFWTFWTFLLKSPQPFAGLIYDIPDVKVSRKTIKN